MSFCRFCLRQRTLADDVRRLSTALTEQFATLLEKSGSEWKHRLGEIERRHKKNVKKCSKKNAQEQTIEYRLGCAEILMEQRTQLGTFASFLLPVIVRLPFFFVLFVKNKRLQFLARPSSAA